MEGMENRMEATMELEFTARGLVEGFRQRYTGL